MYVDLFLYSPSFFDNESDKVLISYLIKNCYIFLNGINKLEFKITHEKFEHDPLTLLYERKKIDDIFNGYNNNKAFKDFVFYVFNNITFKEYLLYNKLLTFVSDSGLDIKFKGDFWSLLNHLSYAYTNHDEKGEMSFIYFYQLSCLKGSLVNIDHLIYFLSYCDIDSSLINVPGSSEAASE